MSHAEFKARVAQPSAPCTIAYGNDPLQHVELWKPAGRGPFPVVVMIHGGCWQTSVAAADIMHALAADLTARGIAVWNVEYRGVDVPGGGYPGTFADVAAAADMLARDGRALGLDTRRVVAMGHSAGGHLALWLAARPRIRASSALWSDHPLPIAGILSAGGLPDLARAGAELAQACGADTIDRLVGPATVLHPDVFADTSPVALLPIGVAQALVAAQDDAISPPRLSEDYVLAARAAGDDPTIAIVPAAGHFELITPSAPAWTVEVAIIRDLLAGHPRPR